MRTGQDVLREEGRGVTIFVALGTVGFALVWAGVRPGPWQL